MKIKSLLFFVCFFFVTFCSSLSLSMTYKPDQFWVCSQLGFQDSSNAYVIALYKDFKDKTYKEVLSFFLKNITEKQKTFEPKYDPVCKAFSEEKDIKEYLKYFMTKATKLNFNVLWIDFNK